MVTAPVFPAWVKYQRCLSWPKNSPWLALACAYKISAARASGTCAIARVSELCSTRSGVKSAD